MPAHSRHSHHYRANARMRAARIGLLVVMGVLIIAAMLSPLLSGSTSGDTPAPRPAPAPYQPR